MKIGIIGSGTMGKSLAELLSKKKHVLMLRTRRPAAIEQWVNENGHEIQVGTYADVA